MPAEGLWPLAKGSNYAKSKQNNADRVCRQKVCGHWRTAQSMQPLATGEPAEGLERQFLKSR
jgi:hypothetical protein